ncbi:condensation domain-containing protein [Nocardia sp. NPDC005998]|uniref:condensation domain-containing protein n=1 Tax=Nocardia sp. NPDC005998 TaxID=3156894 RepID=UPI0033B7C75F
MVGLGLIEDWQPAPGKLVAWKATQLAVAAAAKAPVNPTPPSHQQEEYLKAAHRNRHAGFRFSGLVVITFDIRGTLDTEAMTRAINRFVQRHDTFASWFEIAADGMIARHVVESDAVELAPVDLGEQTDADRICELVQQTTPDPFRWDCFTFGAIVRDDSSTVYAAVDHLHTDGVSQAVTITDLLGLYGSEVSGTASGLSPVGSHFQYCERERKYSSSLTKSSPGVRVWIDLLQRNGGELPAFALPLGVADDGYTRSMQITVPLFSEADAVRFEQLCLDHGGRFSGGVFAVVAMAEQRLAGRDFYFGLTPVDTRTTAAEYSSMGWFASLVPVAFEVSADAGFGSLIAPAQQALTRGKELADVSLHRVLELLTPTDGIPIEPGWSAPTVSYIDARKLVGIEFFDAINGGLFSNRGSSREVVLWINRFPDVTSLSMLFPDTVPARESIDRYAAAIRSVFMEVLDHLHKGDGADKL